MTSKVFSKNEISALKAGNYQRVNEKPKYQCFLCAALALLLLSTGSGWLSCILTSQLNSWNGLEWEGKLAQNSSCFWKRRKWNFHLPRALSILVCIWLLGMALPLSYSATIWGFSFILWGKMVIVCWEFGNEFCEKCLARESKRVWKSQMFRQTDKLS